MTIKTSNHPLPRTFAQLQLRDTISSFYSGFTFSVALVFKFASIIGLIVKERADRSKYQQIISGMNIEAYWIANFVYDFLLYMLVTGVAIGIAKGMEVELITTGDAFAATWILFVLYGLAYLPFTYLASYFFTDYGSAQAFYYFITFLIGGILPVLTSLVRVLNDTVNPYGRNIAWILRLYPSYAFS